MGGTAFCCTYKDKDQHAQDFSKIEDNKKPISQQIRANRIKDVMTRAQNNESKIILL